MDTNQTTNAPLSRDAAVKAQHDAELAKMEADIAAQLAGDAPATANGEGEVTPTAPESAPEVKKPDDESKSEKKVQDDPAPDVGETTPPETPQAPERDLSEDEVKKLSAKAQKRYRAMSQRIKELEERLTLRSTLQPKATPVGTPTAAALPPLPWLAPDEGIMPQVPAVDPREEARVAAREELARDRIVTNINADVESIESRYPDLNPASEDYDEDLALTIKDLYLAKFKDDNTLRLKDFVEDIMGIRAKAEHKAKAQITGKVVKQAATQAISSTASSQKPQTSVEDMIKGAKSLKDLEALESLL